MPNSLSISSMVDWIEVVIDADDSITAGTDLGGRVLTAILMPASWTAADITFQASVDGATYLDVYLDDDSEYTVQAAASRFITVPPSAFPGARWIKVRSGTSATPVAQAAERTLTLGRRAID